MDERFQQLYELLYSPIITPYNLLENAKLDNYDYVNYSKIENGMLVTMKCTIERDLIANFFYFFDDNDCLQMVKMETDEGMETIFDRQSEIEKLKERIQLNNKESFTSIAI